MMEELPLHVTKYQIPPEALYAGVASGGGIAKYMYEYMKTKKFDWKMFIAHTILSAFSGYMFASFASLLGVDASLKYSLSGLGGFMGVRAMDLLEDIIRSKTNTSKQTYGTDTDTNTEQG